MTSIKSLLLASTALLAVATIAPAHAAPAHHALKVAQAAGVSVATDAEVKKKNADEDKNKKAEKSEKKSEKKAEKAEKKAEQAEKKAENAAEKAEKAAEKAEKAENKASQQKDDKKSDTPQKAETAPSSAPKPPGQANKAAADGKPKQAEPANKPATPAAAAGKPADKPAPAAAAEKKESAPDKTSAPASGQAAPASQPEPEQQPATQKQAEPAQQPAEQQKPSQPATQQAAPATEPAPSTSTSKSAAPATSADNDAATSAAQKLEPAKPQDSREFIRKDGAQPERTIKDVRQQRRTTQQEDGRTLILEGDRVIVRDRDRTFIRHNEDRRFAIGARTVRTDRRNGETFTVILRPNGVRIITVTDRDGHLIRRVRRSPDGREVIIIDNRHADRRGVFLDVRSPRIGMARNRYIVDADRANRREIYDLLVAPPVQTIDRGYSLAQVRYNAPLREYMRRLDLDIHFETGSWQITPEQMDRLSVVAEALNRAIDRNPREVFLIEGHTDAIGSDEDNLSLSDRRAESVAVALTEVFKVPPENLVTQGYGEQELKVETQEPSRVNRRVAMRRITPLINRTARR